MLGFMPQRQDGVLARGLRQPIRLGIDRFPPPCAGIGGEIPDPRAGRLPVLAPRTR